MFVYTRLVLTGSLVAALLILQATLPMPVHPFDEITALVGMVAVAVVAVWSVGFAPEPLKIRTR